MQNDNYLQHYGVLGMKWGVRKAEKEGRTYKYKSHYTKRYEKKAAKAKIDGKTDKADIYAKRAKRAAKLDAKVQKQSLGVSTGKTIAARLLVPTNIAGAQSSSYQMYRALGDSKTRAILKTGFGGELVYNITKANYVRGKGRYAKAELKGKK